MLKGLGDIGNLMKMQKEMKSIQKRLKKMNVEGESPDGSIKAIVNGEYSLVDISIDEKLVESADKNKIQKMVLSAVNDAVDKVKQQSASEMAGLAGGMDLSSFMK